METPTSKAEQLSFLGAYIIFPHSKATKEQKMTTIIAILSILMKLSSSEQSAAFISSDTELKPYKSVSKHGTRNPFYGSMPITHSVAVGAKGAGRDSSSPSSKRTFIPSMSIGSNNHQRSLHSLLLSLDESEYGMESLNHNDNELMGVNSNAANRRSFLSKLAASYLTAGAAATNFATTAPAFAVDSANTDDSVYNRVGKGFEYSFLPPTGFKSSNKPLKTHLDEINFSLEGVRGYQYGITVDPVRIDSLKQVRYIDHICCKSVA